MKNLYMVGGGGFGLELADYLLTDIRAGHLVHQLAGIFDYSPDNQVCRAFPEIRFMGSSLVEHAFGPNDQILAAVGDPIGRRKVAQDAAAAGVALGTFVHSSAQVSATATLGAGTLICPNVIVNANAVLEANVMVNVFSSVGHGSRVGAHSVLSPFCSISGNASVGRMCFMGTRATVFPRVHMGEGCTVDAHSTVRQHVGARKIVTSRGNYQVLDNRLAPKD